MNITLTSKSVRPSVGPSVGPSVSFLKDEYGLFWGWKVAVVVVFIVVVVVVVVFIVVVVVVVVVVVFLVFLVVVVWTLSDLFTIKFQKDWDNLERVLCCILFNQNCKQWRLYGVFHGKTIIFTQSYKKLFTLCTNVKSFFSRFWFREVLDAPYFKWKGDFPIHFLLRLKENWKENWKLIERTTRNGLHIHH